MTNVFELNCLVFGDTARHVFSVKALMTESIATVKELVKSKKLAFRDIDADTLQLWKVSVAYQSVYKI